MLLKSCRCGKLIPQSMKMCEECEQRQQSRHMIYNNTRRDERAAEFYVSKEWRAMRERIIEVYDNIDIYALYVEHELLTCNPVHHIIELEDDWEQRLNPFNLIPLNHKTHNTTVDAETIEKMTTFESDEDAAGQQEDAENGGTASNDAETTNPPSEPETGENGANTEPQEAEDEPEDKVIIPQGKMKVTVICDGSLNIRRSAAWGNENICGRAIRGQSYYVKEIHVVDGKKMVRTIGDLYLSGESEHVQFEQL